MSDPSFTVEVRPSGLHFEVAAEETVFQAAARAGLRWPTVCGGNGTCGTCVSTVIEGDEHCSPVGAHEQETFAVVLRQRDRQGRRLVCQLRITGPVTVSKRGVRPKSSVPEQPQP